MTQEERYNHYYNEGYNAGSFEGYEQGYEDAINKACEWLESNCTHLVLMKGEYYDSKEIVEQFKKAMKGE